MNPLLLRALVVGMIGGAALVLTMAYSRRGPMILPVYAGLLIALAFIAARFETVAYMPRLVAVFAAFCLASAELYVAAVILAGRERKRLVARGRLPASALRHRLPLGGHVWRVAALAGAGIVLSAVVAFVVA
jgi:hypothetical protein